MGNSLGSCSTLCQRKRIKKKTEDSPIDESFSFDELIIGILGRLPTKDVLRSRCVCKRWRYLTLTRYFTDLHIRGSIPMFLKGQKRVVLLDRCWEPARTRSKIFNVYQPFRACIHFSHNGLIIARGVDGKFIINNPIYCDMVNITPQGKPNWSEPLGFFFHPLRKENCTLWRVTVSLEPWKVQYKILNLESNPNWRDIMNPCTQNNRISLISPLLINNYIYWMVEPSKDFRKTCNYRDSTFNCDIMEFDIRNENFRIMPSPVPVVLSHHTYNVNLINIDGVALLVQVSPSKELTEINIWTITGHKEHLWTCSNYIISYDVYPEYGVPIPIAFRNGELVLQSNERLFVCNLELGTFKKFGSRHHYRPHLVSLASLRNWKSKTCMVEDGKNNNKDGGCGEEIQAPKKL